jgi:quercetin dioxygenase-like cupin family protein
MRQFNVGLFLGLMLGGVSVAVAGKSVAEVRTVSQAPVKWAPSGKASVQLLARGDNAFLGLLSMDAGAGVPEHQDSTEEYIVVLEGGGTISIDGQSTSIAKGDAVFMPANATVSFKNGPEPMRALQVFAGPQPAEKYQAWLAEKP